MRKHYNGPKRFWTPQQEDMMREGACEICGERKRLVFDHDHRSNRWRGVLCYSCNVGLGAFKDSPDRLMQAAMYLERAEKQDLVDSGIIPRDLQSANS